MTSGPSKSRSALDFDWLSSCRRVVEAQREILARYQAPIDLTAYSGQGASGDMTLAIDKEFEDVIFEELARLNGGGFRAISEERGQVDFGTPEGDVLVVIDPIDGSENAKRGIPSFSLSLAVADGGSMADVVFGYVYDFGTNEEWLAVRGQGAKRNGELLDPRALDLAAEAAKQARPDRELGIVGFESAEPALIRGAVETLADRVYLIRVIGAIAIALPYVGAARMDGMLTAGTCRSVDAAAGQLIAREAGATVVFENLELDEAQLSLDARYRLCAARTDAGLELVAAAQAATGA